jgi:hypothetical protein
VFLTDAYETARDFASDAIDVGGDVVHALPGGDELLGAARDFANTATGQTVLRAFSTMLYASVAWPLGPQLASVAFAVPGLFKGEQFENAWLQEVKWRAEKTAEILGPGIVDAFGSQLASTLKQMADEYGVTDYVNMGVREFAARYRIREDVAAFALAIWNKIELPRRDEFDPATGKQIGQWSPVPIEPCAALAERHARFGANDPRPDLVATLTSACSNTAAQRELAADEYRLLYGAREYAALGYEARERAALTRAEAPRSGDSEGRNYPGAIALAAVAAAALVAWRLRLL